MTEPKEQAVPVVGVEEAVERLTRTLANKDQRDKRQPDHQFAGLATVNTDDLRTILQALQGSSACADTHRATEQPVVTDEMIEMAAFAVERDRAISYGWTDEQFDIWFHRDPLFVSKTNCWGFHFTGTEKEKLFHEMRLGLMAALSKQAATSDDTQVGTQSRSDEVHEKAQLKAAYEALEFIASGTYCKGYARLAARQALARRVG